LPRERLCYLLKEGRAQVVLTQSWVDSRLEWPEDVQRISVDTFDPAEWPDEPPPPCQEPDDLAYVIFTSGSTGHPKGVMIEHGAALNTIADINRRFEVGDQDRVLAVSALNFDLSVYDIFGLLAAGGTLVVPDPDSLREPARWLDWVESHRITFWNSVPALVEMLVEEAEAGRGAALKSLRLCLMSGDWIPPALAGRLRGLNPGIEVISGGGATEASIWSILYPIGEVDPDWKSIPYGRPMANQRFYVLDGQLQPRPCWVPGQLYIGGDGLARGYWRDQQKTDAAFVHHPVSGQRLYRTGDLGRFLPDGNIEFLGREDTQVKVQGMRIELGEVEAALRSHPAVQAAVVEAVGELRGHKRLVAYVVGRRQEAGGRRQEEGERTVGSWQLAVGSSEEESEESPKTKVQSPRSSQNPALEPAAYSLQPTAFPDLRRFLATKLPQYMIPATFVTLEALPLSPNGKVDRAALPSPEQEAAKREEGSAAPRNPVEEAVKACWAERFTGQEFGISDDFFQLGGDSLLAMRVLLDLQELFPVEIPLRTIFERPTVAELAQGIDELLLEAVESMPEEELQSSL
ncbi:MAG: non-ribosomal peptide synthetase, partial [Acidobacteriota bacterium]